MHFEQGINKVVPECCYIIHEYMQLQYSYL